MRDILFKRRNKQNVLEGKCDILFFDNDNGRIGFSNYFFNITTSNFSNDTFVVIREGKRRVNYHFADPEVIVAPPEKQLVLPSQDVCFQLDHSQLLQLVKAAGVYKLPDLSVVGEEGTISLVVRDKKNDSSNIFSVDVGETDVDFCFNFKVENTNKILHGNYDVSISQKLLAQFTGTKNNVEYFIALEPDSSFG